MKKLGKLIIKNFVGLEDTTIEFSKPVSMFVGDNNAGKSSIRDAISWVMTGKCRGISKAKDFDLLVHAGAKKADMRAILEYQEMVKDSQEVEPGIAARDAKKGFKGIDENPLIPYCLDPMAFIRLPAKERMRILSDLTGSNRDLVRTAIKEVIGTVPVDIKESLKGVDLLDLDSFKTAIVEYRRGKKRTLATLQDSEPKLADVELEKDFKEQAVRDGLAAISDRITKGEQYLGGIKVDLTRRAKIADLKNTVNELEGKLKPDVVIADNQAIRYHVNLSLLISVMLKMDEADCPFGCGRKLDQLRLVELDKIIKEGLRDLQAANEKNIKHNEDQVRFRAEIEKAKGLIESLGEADNVDPPVNGSEAKLKELRLTKERIIGRLLSYGRYKGMMTAYLAGQREIPKIETLINTADTIDEALKDGGAIRQYISEHGTPFPVNESLRSGWNVPFELQDNGEIMLNGRAIELASDSEKYRVAGLIGMALSDIGNVGYCAWDGFDILTLAYRNAVELVCSLEVGAKRPFHNLLVFCSMGPLAMAKLAAVKPLDWLEIFKVTDGKIEKM